MSKFNRGHYEAIADIIHKALRRASMREHRHGIIMLMRDLIDEFAKDNPEFDADKFVTRCYM